MKKRVLLVLTGGTICSARGQDKLNDLDTEAAVPGLLSMYEEATGDRNKEMVVTLPLNTLSENMTIEKWNCLLNELAKYRTGDSKLDGIIILHGTDTLHFTGPLVGEFMKGVRLPVILVSSHRILEDPEANGLDNLKVAMKLIDFNIPGTYVPYRNVDGSMYLHRAKDLEECPDYSEDFHSKTEMVLDMNKPDYGLIKYDLFAAYDKNLDAGKENFQLVEISDSWPGSDNVNLKNNVLYIKPYVGLDFSQFKIDKVKAVLLGLYHSSTVRTEGGDDDETSALYLLKRCKEKGIDLYIFPCQKDSFRYSSTKPLLEGGAIPLYGGTFEKNYIDLIIKYSVT
ncbi:MAG: asparaginase [Eubacterium sp.]|nr:asparaginase [Eubacterium sp.]